LFGLITSLLLISLPIKEIRFIGNDAVPAKHLQAETISKPGEEYKDLDINYDVDRIIRLYRSRGFFSTEVKPEVTIVRDTVTIVFQVEEGSRPTIDSIVVEGDSLRNLRSLFKIHVGDHFILSKLNDTERAIQDRYKDRGYPFAEVRYSVFPDSGVLVFEIEKGMLYYVRNIEVRGLTRTRPHLVEREIELESGDMYSKSKVYDSQRRIYALGFFSTLRVEMLRVQSDSLDLIFTVKELKSRILNFGVGMSLPFSFLLSFGFEELNLANIGHRVNISPLFKFNIEKEWEAKIEARYTFPYVTSLGLKLSILPFVWFEEKTDFSRQTRGNESRLAKVFTEDVALTLSHRYKYVRIEPKVTLPDTIKGVTNSVKTQFLLDLRDEFFDPRKGFYFTPSIEYAGGIFGGANHFLRLESEERVFYPLLGNTAALRFKIGVLVPTNGVSVYEKYFLGGQYTLRGYPEFSIGPDSIGDERYGNILLNFNVEYRVHLPWNFGLVGFFDAGYVDNEMDLTDTEYLKTTAGIGLRYFTPIGPLRFDLGFPLQEKGSEFYFGIYHMF
jgi:outer membrane protein insertion porin family